MHKNTKYSPINQFPLQCGFHNLIETLSHPLLPGVRERVMAKASDVTAVNVRWDRGQNFGDLLQDADFNLVTTREQQAEAKRASKAAANTSAGQTTSGSTGQQPGTGGTGGGELGE